MKVTNKEAMEPRGQKIASHYPDHLQERTEQVWKTFFKQPEPPKKIIRFEGNYTWKALHVGIHHNLNSWGLGFSIEGSAFDDWNVTIHLLSCRIEVGRW